MTAKRLAWTLWGIAMALAVGALAFLVLAWSTPAPEGQFGFRGFSMIFAVAFGTPGALIAARHPRNAIGWVFLGVAILSGLQELANQYAIYAVLQRGGEPPLGEVAAWIPAWIWMPGTSGALFLLLLVPNGRPVSPRWWSVAWMGAVGTILGALGLALSPGPLENFHAVRNPFGPDALGPALDLAGAIGQFIYGLAIVLAAVSLVVRLRRSRGEERQQLKWLAASGLFVALTLSASLLGQLLSPRPTTAVPFVVALLVIAGFASLPVATGIAILRHRLFDIDVVINKTLVYAGLAAFITLVYAGIVVGIGTLAGSRGSPFLSAVAAAVVALAFQPARRAAQRVANRVVYGKRATPYEILSDFSTRLAGSYSVDDVLPRMARVLGEGAGALRATIWLRSGKAYRPAATCAGGAEPAPLDPPFEVRQQGELLGAIGILMPSSEPLGPTQEKLIRDVAGQAGLVLRNVLLIEELRASRQRLVTAQDEERRRIERNIHDGAQQQLVALAVRLRLALGLVGKDEDRERRLLEELHAEAERTLEDLRDLARGIYPPLLADEGLPAALQAQARRSPVPAVVEADGVGRHPPEVEAAVYFCCLEALQNAAKYSEAHQVRLRLSDGGGELVFEVTDDGRGFDPDATPKGSGLQNIADRIEALGGRVDVRSAPGRGAAVRGRVPIPSGETAR
jgi:signal transduction histidine kinase